MNLFKPIWKEDKKTKIDELNEHTDILDSIKKFNNVLKNPIVTLATKEEISDSDFVLIQTDPYPLYVNTKTNNMYISYDNNKTFEQVVNCQTNLKELNLNPLNSNEEFFITANIDETNIVDAVGTSCQGTFNKNYRHVFPSITTTENELERRLKELESKLAKTVSLVHNCANCGATLEVEENKPVIHCKYCGSTYLVGTARIYSNY